MREQFELLSQIDASPGVCVELNLNFWKSFQSLLWEAQTVLFDLLLLKRAQLIATKLLKAVFV